MDTYKIISIDEEKGTVTVVYSFDGKEQTLANAPIDGLEGLQTFLTNYGIAYKKGLEIEATPIVPDEVANLIGQDIEIEDN